MKKFSGFDFPAEFSGPYMELERKKLVIPMEIPKGDKWLFWSEDVNGGKKVEGSLDFLIDREEQTSAMRERERHFAKDAAPPLYTAEWFAEKGISPRYNSSGEIQPFENSSENMSMQEREAREILGVSQDADIFEIRRAVQRLSLLYHPDRVKQQMERLKRMEESLIPDDLGFGVSSFFLREYLSAYGAFSFNILSQSEYNSLPSEDQEKYKAKMQDALRDMEKTYLKQKKKTEEDIQQRMKEKFQQIQEAWRIIKDGVSESDLDDTASLWEDVANERTTSYGFRDVFKFQRITLSSDPEMVLLERDIGLSSSILRKDDEMYKTFHPAYDSRSKILLYKNEDYLGYSYYEDVIPVECFIAFLDHIRGVPIRKCLVSEMCEHYGLDEAESSLMLDMIRKGADPEKIVETIFREMPEEDAQRKREGIKGDIHTILFGPRYILSDWIGVSYEEYVKRSFAMGVKIREEGVYLELLVWVSHDKYPGWERDVLTRKEIFFNKDDMRILRAVAEGRKFPREKKRKQIVLQGSEDLETE